MTSKYFNFEVRIEFKDDYKEPEKKKAEILEPKFADITMKKEDELITPENYNRIIPFDL